MREQWDAVASKLVSPSVTPRAEHLKLHVSSYMGREGEALLRWLVKLDIVITARHIVDPLLRSSCRALAEERGVGLTGVNSLILTRQWPLPREQVKAIDAFFESRQVRESKSPDSAPTFCVIKPQGGWRIIHTYNKLNDATVPAQTPIPRKDVLLNNMSGCTLYSALDLVDGYYQILMRESDIPLTAVSTPRGMLWEWLVMPQGLSNAPATFNRLVTQLFRQLRTFAQTYFDDISSIAVPKVARRLWRCI
ncbi:LOW QUALITY PROTEIN: Pol protein [Phytophthora palmivora]|uniref:Pol protein n=1 Tax=Phytophthora palmivora TaxID=4796 RepID=A0A2P4XSK1_9STRA|nr:LOW QUALITY PROTEIN: Pol protein [Phytophthora palmivora]